MQVPLFLLNLNLTSTSPWPTFLLRRFILSSGESCVSLLWLEPHKPLLPPAHCAPAVQVAHCMQHSAVLHAHLRRCLHSPSCLPTGTWMRPASRGEHQTCRVLPSLPLAPWLSARPVCLPLILALPPPTLVFVSKTEGVLVVAKHCILLLVPIMCTGSSRSCVRAFSTLAASRSTSRSVVGRL